MSTPDGTGQEPRPPQPRYGEYAPPGWVSPVTGQEGTPAPVEGPAVSPPVTSPSGYAAPQYLPGKEGQVAYQGSAEPATGQRTRKTWDLVLTIVFLGMGLFGAGFGILYGVIFAAGTSAFGDMGITLPEGIEAQGLTLVLSHAGLYLAAVIVSVVLLLRKRLAFYVPLAAGVIAAIVFWAIIYPVFADPAMLEQFYSVPTA